MAELPVHSPDLKDQSSNDIELEKWGRRARRIKAAYGDLEDEHASKKSAAAKLGGTDENILFTKRAIELPESSPSLRYFHLKYKPKPQRKEDEQHTFRYVVVAADEDQLGDIGDMWLWFLWGENEEGFYERGPEFISLHGEVLDWRMRIEELDVNDGVTLKCHTWT